MSERLPFIAADIASQRLLALAEKVAPAATTLLITGESGAGKDHFARLIHELSPRRDAPFLKIDCSSLPAQLIESELSATSAVRLPERWSENWVGWSWVAKAPSS